MQLTLFGRKSSSNVQKVVWLLEELGLDYEHLQVGGPYGGLDTAEYGGMNPNRLVPTLRDGDFVLWESHAIVRYLAAAYGAPRFFPPAPRDRAVVDQWTDWTATTFGPAWIQLFWRAVRNPQPDPAAVSASLAETVRCLRMMEERLATVPYLAGGELSYADIVAGVSLYRWTTMEIERPSLPHVEAWHARLDERPAFRKAVNVNYDELRGRLAF